MTLLQGEIVRERGREKWREIVTEGGRKRAESESKSEMETIQMDNESEKRRVPVNGTNH